MLGKWHSGVNGIHCKVVKLADSLARAKRDPGECQLRSPPGGLNQCLPRDG